VGSKFKNSLEGNELKQRTASDIKKSVNEIHPRSRKSNLTLHQYPCKHLLAVSKKVDLEIKNIEKGI